VGRETPASILGALSQPVSTTWCPCPPGQTRIKYDGNFSFGINPYLELNWEPGKEWLGTAHRM